MRLKSKILKAIFLATLFSVVFFWLSSFSLAGSSDKEDRIYGHPTDGKNWPYFVVFTDKGTDLYNRCAGVLVRPRWVLTAPSGCMQERLQDSMAFVGATKSNPYDGKKRGIKQVYLHPRYNSDQGDWDINPTWNIGLVKLKKPVFAVPRVPFATRKPAIGSEITSVGLGNSILIGKEEEDYFSLLQSSVRVVSQSLCQKYLPGQNQGHRSLFCAWTAKQGPCMLDEGTGAFQDGKLYGLFNLLWSEGYGPICPENRGAGYYSAVAPALPWIRSVLRRGYDKGRFLLYGAYIFPDKETNLYLWSNQEVSRSSVKMRLSSKVCSKKQCFPAGKWIPLGLSVTGSPKKSNYWMNSDLIYLRSKKRCVRGKVRVRFDYMKKGSYKQKAFRSCLRKN